MYTRGFYTVFDIATEGAMQYPRRSTSIPLYEVIEGSFDDCMSEVKADYLFTMQGRRDMIAVFHRHPKVLNCKHRLHFHDSKP